MQIFPAATRPETPWKNGGGVTRLVTSAQGGSREFGWRLSLADVSASGPFSCFPGISRLMGILTGELQLEVEGLAPVTLHPNSPAFAFSGAIPASGTPLGNLVQDINLMFDPACFTATLTYAAHGIEQSTSKATRLLLALEPLQLNGIALARLDAALVPPHAPLVAPTGALWVASLYPLP